MNYMSGHIMVFEIELNLIWCPLNILDLQPGGASQVTGASLDRITSFSFKKMCCSNNYFVLLSYTLNPVKYQLF